jgi:hypothetical protein
VRTFGVKQAVIIAVCLSVFTPVQSEREEMLDAAEFLISTSGSVFRANVFPLFMNHNKCGEVN